jgi:hypothetical protein
MAEKKRKNQPIDIEASFAAISKSLLAYYEAARASIKHDAGLGAALEEQFRSFLRNHLPRRYGVSSGEVAAFYRERSGQRDIIIYDALEHQPIWPGEYRVFPIENVYAVLEITTTLTKQKLKKDALKIREVKRLVRDWESTTACTLDGKLVKMPAPIPYGAIVAFGCNQSLEAVKSWVEDLDKVIIQPRERVNLICILGQGLITRWSPDRFKEVIYPHQIQGNEEVWTLEEAENTLLEFIDRLIKAMNSMILRPVDLRKYFSGYRLIGEHVVRVWKRESVEQICIRCKKAWNWAERIDPQFIDQIIANKDRWPVMSYEEAVRKITKVQPSGDEPYYKNRYPVVDPDNHLQRDDFPPQEYWTLDDKGNEVTIKGPPGLQEIEIDGIVFLLPSVYNDRLYPRPCPNCGVSE